MHSNRRQGPSYLSSWPRLRDGFSRILDVLGHRLNAAGWIARVLLAPVRGARDEISDRVLSWDGVTVHAARFGAIQYRRGRREIGHVHGDSIVDIPFPKPVRNRLVADGQAWPHHVLPRSGWVSCYISTPADVDRAVALLRESYELACRQRQAVREPLSTGGDAQ